MPQRPEDIPRVELLPSGHHQLLVDGAPYLIRGAELNNSSLSSPRYMKEIWPKAVACNVNTLFGAVGWDIVEPDEGVYNFAALDEVIDDARFHGIRLALLWFGAMKNGQSNYVPGWVKRDVQRFPKCQVHSTADGSLRMINCMSLHGSRITAFDARAFAELMKHLKQIDSVHRTVIMVQVENECGMLGDSRDRSPAASQAFREEKVPDSLVKALNDGRDSFNPLFMTALERFFRDPPTSRRSWEQVFGTSARTDELFMTYHTARHVETVAAAGREVYPLPLYTNAWLRSLGPELETGMGTAQLAAGSQPGEYPSGGPSDTVLDMWHLLTPSLFTIAPDIYFDDYDHHCRSYGRHGKPLLIPEQRIEEDGMLRTWSAFGTHGALGVSPFGFDQEDPADSSLANHYSLLRRVSPLILAARQAGQAMFGFHFDRYEKGSHDPAAPCSSTMGTWKIVIQRTPVPGHPSPAYGLVIQTSPDQFCLIGEGFSATFTSTLLGTAYSGIAHVKEKDIDELDHWFTLRTLNGDEVSGDGRAAYMPWSRPDLGACPIHSFIPARTKVAEVVVYRV